MHTAPLVSVIALCYNHSKFVLDCLESLRRQRYENIELIICDDASKDDSADIISRWLEIAKVKCIFIRHEKNRGLCATINEALRYSQGKYYTLIATDDIWEPGRLESSVACLERSPTEVGVAFTDVYQIDESGNRLPQTFLQSLLGNKEVPEGDILERLILGNFVPAMGALIRRAVYDEIGGYDENLLYEDWDFWLRAAAHYRFAFIDIPSANYRIVANSMARTHLAKSSPPALYTYYLIHSKLRSVARLGETSRSLVEQRLADTARELYAIGFQHLPRFAAKHIRKSKKSNAGKMAFLCLLGVPWASYTKWTGYIQWKLKRLLPSSNQ